MNPGTFQGPGLGQIFNYPFQYGWWHETSTTWIVPYSGVYQIWACGGGGSGSSYVTGTGGGAGGIGIKRSFLNRGQRLVITIGAGGAGVNNFDGNTGGTTTVIGGPINLGAFGGTGGTGANGNGFFTGVSGGRATGADVFFQGGSGGDARTVSGDNGASSGGGAVNLKGLATPPAGGYAKNGGAAGLYCASGGGGIGGAGGTAENSTVVDACSTGGGAMRPGFDANDSIATATDAGQRGFNDVAIQVPYGLFAGNPYNANTTTIPPVGCGSGGVQNTASAVAYFGGTGGSSRGGGSGRAIWGGGSGATRGGTSGAGGNGWVFIGMVQQ